MPSSNAAGSAMTSFESTKMLAFLSEHRVLECVCCSGIMGFQHKVTGALYCVGGCHERSPESNGTTGLMAKLAPKLEIKDVPSAATNSVVAGSGQLDMLNQLKRMSVGGDNVDSGPKAAPPVSKPVEPAKAATPAPQKPSVAPTIKPAQAPVPVPTPVTPAPKPAPSPATKPMVPTSAAKAVASSTANPPARATMAPKRYLWADMKYSEKLLGSDALVRVLFAWAPTKYTVAADADEGAMVNLTCALKEYAKSSSPMKQPPVIDEIVVGEYFEEYYRARVTKIQGDECELEFIDFGDKKTCKYTEVFPIKEELMKLPVYGLIVQLRLPVSVANYKLSQTLEKWINEEAFILDLNKKGPKPTPGQAEQLEVRLWDAEKENTINEKITAEVASSARK